MTALLTLGEVSARRGAAQVLEHVSLSVRPGEVVAVVGPNGAGKTSLLRAALGLQPISAGVVRLGEADPKGLSPDELARRVGYLPQDRRLAWNLPAWRIAALGSIRAPSGQAEAAGREALARVGLAHMAERGVFDMSGGERARVLLARLFATGAPLLLADEPTAGLDPDAQLLVLELLREEARRGGAVVLTLHDLGHAARACDRLLVLRQGRVAAEGPPADTLTPAVLAEVFSLDGGLIQTPAGMVLAARRISGDAA